MFATGFVCLIFFQFLFVGRGIVVLGVRGADDPGGVGGGALFSVLFSPDA